MKTVEEARYDDHQIILRGSLPIAHYRDQTEMGDPSRLWQEYIWSETSNHIWRWWNPLWEWSSIGLLEGELSFVSFYVVIWTPGLDWSDWQSLDLSAVRGPWPVKVDRSIVRYTQCLWFSKRSLPQVHKAPKWSSVYSWSARRRWRGMFVIYQYLKTRN